MIYQHKNSLQSTPYELKSERNQKLTKSLPPSGTFGKLDLSTPIEKTRASHSDISYYSTRIRVRVVFTFVIILR